MFTKLWGRNTNKQFNLENSYMIVEFLTEDQKIMKDKILDQLQKQYENNYETIVPYKDSFECSYRYTLCSNSIKGKILLAETMALIEASNDNNFQQFYEVNVKKIKLHMKKNKLVNSEDILELYNQRDINLYNPDDVLEVIYEKKGFLQRIKLKGKKFIKNLPQHLLSMIGKLFAMILQFFGLGSASKILSKFLPVKVVLKWALNLIMLFFPMLAPLVGIGSLMI